MAGTELSPVRQGRWQLPVSSCLALRMDNNGVELNWMVDLCSYTQMVSVEVDGVLRRLNMSPQCYPCILFGHVGFGVCGTSVHQQHYLVRSPPSDFSVNDRARLQLAIMYRLVSEILASVLYPTQRTNVFEGTTIRVRCLVPREASTS
jgi:hypothetical protein